MVLGKLPVPGRPTFWIIVGQGPIALAVHAGGGSLDILLFSILSLLFFPLSGRGVVGWCDGPGLTSSAGVGWLVVLGVTAL